jgi:hypothetical protein
MPTTEDLHLRLARPSLARGVRLLVEATTACVIAPLSVRYHAGVWEWLAREWSPARELPQGRQWHAASDAIVVALESAQFPTSDALLRAIQPRTLQRIAALVWPRSSAMGLSASVWDRGTLLAPSSLQIVGARGGRWDREATTRTPEASGASVPKTESATSPSSQQLRWSRTVRTLPGPLPPRDDLHVAIVGQGRMGTLMAQALSPYVGKLTLFDGDHMGHENLDAMPLARERDVGRFKVQVSARQLLANRRDLAVYTVPQELRSPTARRVFAERRFDLLVTCVDERGLSARLLAAQLARQYLLPHLDVGTLIRPDENGARLLTGDVRLFEPAGPGCVVCCPPLATDELRQAQAELASPSGSLPPGPHRDWSATRLGTAGHWNNLVCGVAVETWLRFAAGQTTSSTWHRLLWRHQAPLPEFHTATFSNPAGCSICRIE